MAEFKKIVITKKGQALMAKMMAGTGNIAFTKVSISDTTYTDAQLESLTSLTGIKQSTLISKITRVNDVSIKLEAAITNADLKTGYYMRTVGVYANDPQDGEILYGVMIANVAGWMPPFNGIGASSAMFNLYVTVGNSGNVSITVDKGAVATVSDVQVVWSAITDLQAYIGYNDPDIYGVEVDFKNKRFTRLAGALNKTPGAAFDSINMFGGRKRCNVTNDGKVVAYYGDAGYTETGKLKTAITIEEGSNVGTYAAGTIVQVMVEQPKFYYKTVPMELEPIDDGYGFHMRKARYYVSETPKAGFKLHPGFISDGKELEKIYLSAYEGSLWDASASLYILDDSQVADFTNDMLCSIGSVKPASGLTQNLCRTNLRKLAQKRGSGWQLSYAATVSITQMLFMIEYASFNMQEKIGIGVTNKTDDGTSSMTEITGATANLGNASGAVKNSNGYTVISYRGEENFFGNIWKFIDGMNIDRAVPKDGKPQKHDLYISDHDFDDTAKTDAYGKVGFRLPITEGYISAFGYDEKYDWLFMTSETKGNSSLPVGDYFYRHPDYNGMLAARLGGSWADSSAAGGFSWYLNYAASTRARTVGGRLVYVPTV